MNIAVILAGGSGLRFGSELPKQFLLLGDKPVIVHCIQAFQNHSEIDEIVVVCIKNHIDKLKEYINDYSLDKVKKIVPGGETFMDSCRNGVYSLKEQCDDSDLLLITSGDRPLISSETISSAISTCEEFGNSVASYPCNLCICRKYDDYSSNDLLSRDTLQTLVTPWTFKFGNIFELLQQYEKGDLVCDEPYPYALLIANGEKVYFSKNNDENIKITFKRDLLFAEYLLNGMKRGEK